MNSSYLFHFQGFIEEMRRNKPEVVEKYEENYGGLEGKELEDMPFYKDYLTKYQVDKIVERLQVPEELVSDFDYHLLVLLVVGSFSSEYFFDYVDDTDKIRLKIAVHSGGQAIVKKLDVLWSFQINRLFEIYIEEQMNLENLISESEDETSAISREREMRLKRFNNRMTVLSDIMSRASGRRDNANRFHEQIYID